MRASSRIGTQTIDCTDSTVKHDFSFTAAFSFLVECESDDEIRRLHDALVAGGTAPLPIASYGFSRMFAWRERPLRRFLGAEPAIVVSSAPMPGAGGGGRAAKLTASGAALIIVFPTDEA
jgi:3-demethylubiquinone-9 3-methyltransferase